MDAIPITILTGFLGSGKTTLIRELLGRSLVRDTAFLVNELGAIAIDDALIQVHSSELAVLSGGCLCCELGSSLLGALVKLRERLASLPGFRCERVVVETTGLADPVPLLQSMLAEECASLGFRLDGVVTTIDCVSGRSNVERFAEARRQVSMADRIVITKRDLAPQSEFEELDPLMRELSGAGSIVDVSPMTPPTSNLLDVGGLNPRTRTVSASVWLGSNRRGALVLRGSHTPHIRVECIETTTRMRFSDFVSWLMDMQERFGDRMLRVKGILKVKEHAEPIVVHGVQRVFHPPMKLARDTAGANVSKLVIIGEGFDAAFFNRSMREAGLIEEDLQELQ
jgi:G3E family GTPase